METVNLFEKILGDKFIDCNNLMNGSTKWQYECTWGEYTLLRRDATSFVIAWKAVITPGHVTWAQGHYVDGSFDDAYTVFKKLANI